MVVIKSKRFILRSYRKGDEKSLQKNIHDKNIYRYTLRIPYPYKLKDAKSWVKKCINLAKMKNKKFLNLAIEVNNEVAGGVGLENIGGYKAEIGYWLAKKHWRRGIITEAVKLITHYGFKKLKLKRIYAHVILQNKASTRVLEKNKFKLEGILKKHHIKDGKYFDIAVYAKVR